MKIAVPVKMNKENPPVAPLFGKAKWFAIVEDGKIEILPNNCSGGREVVEWLYSLGVEVLLIQEIGLTPYQRLKSYGNMTIYHTGFERILLKDAIKKFEDNELVLLDDTNIEDILKHHHNGRNRHGHGKNYNNS